MEFVRHRKFSFAQESTRYCNYSKDKFGEEITFIIPTWSNIDEGRCHFDDSLTYMKNNRNKLSLHDVDFLEACAYAERKYLSMLAYGTLPQEARNVLPLATKCDMIMTGFIDDWKHFFALRADGITGAPHPQAKELAEPLKQEFIKLNLI